MSNKPADHILWIDCEMTGLNPDVDGLCEVAVIITDFALRPVHPGCEIIIHPGNDALDQMNDFVRNMHKTSGLLPLIESGVTLEDAQTQLIAYVKEHVPESFKPIVAGNSIGMDRRFIAKYLPAFDELLHYRSIDVSTIKELARQWYPAAFFDAPTKNGGHRALADIAESIRELAYFRDTVMVAPAGPSHHDTVKIAESTIAEYAHLVHPEPQNSSI